jgi:hypothetical protein
MACMCNALLSVQIISTNVSAYSVAVLRCTDQVMRLGHVTVDFLTRLGIMSTLDDAG